MVQKADYLLGGWNRIKAMNIKVMEKRKERSWNGIYDNDKALI